MTAPKEVDPRAFHDFEHAGWQRAAVHYASTFGTLTSQAVGPLLEAVAPIAGVRLLDVASGPGYVAATAASGGATAVALDFSATMVNEVRRRYPAIEALEGDAEALAFEDARFEAVVMNFGLLHLARPEAAIAEAHRVLTQGGRYAFTVWANPDDAVGFGLVLRAMERFGTTDVGLPEGPPFFRFSDAGESRRALEGAGFVDVDVRKLPIVWQLPSAEVLFEAALHGGVRTSAALQAQTPQALDAIRLAVVDEAERYRGIDGIALPMGVVLARGTKR